MISSFQLRDYRATNGRNDNPIPRLGNTPRVPGRAVRRVRKVSQSRY